MILDSQLLFSDAQALTSAVGSTNTIDLSAVRDIGTGSALYVFVSVDVAFTDAGSNSTLTVTLEGDSTTSFTPDGTENLGILPALSAAGYTRFFRLDPGSAPLGYRYIRLLYTPNNGDFTTCTLTSGIIIGPQQFTAYADNLTIS